VNDEGALPVNDVIPGIDTATVSFPASIRVHHVISQLRQPAHRVILRAVAGSTRANDVASGVDSATTRGMT
jgi:hypothetical protein